MTETTETKFTPGPWKCDGNADDRAYGISAKGPEGFSRPVVVWRGMARPASEEGLANARLIAAAPELFDLLAEAMDSRAPDLADAEHPGWGDRARAALAKARGEPQ